MKRDAEKTPTRSRARKKTVPAPPPPEPSAEPTPTAGAGDGKNVGSLESGISLAAGVLFLVAALFPRSIKQLLLLGIGGGLIYRGMTGKSGVYAALGIDTARESLIKQVNEKYLS